MKRILRILLATSGGGFIISMALLMWLTNEFLSSPKEPNPNLGNLVPYMNHGTIFYITEQDYWNFLLIRWCIAGSAALAVVVLVLQTRSGNYHLDSAEAAL